MATTKISPFLWFDNQAEEAANLYTSIFKNSEIKNIARYSGEGAKASGQPEGTVMTVAFLLDGQNFTAINGGPIFKFTEAVSFVINCENQEEVDHFWNKLTEGGQESQCGWLKDKFGLSWQVVPKQLGELMSGPNAGKVMGAMLKMKKIIIKDLEDAANQQ
ncbi:MAG: 3-demethylubiquinone-9 3-methyltransferase [Chitinophagaceae bacterium]|nr:3-demethylubiquinone-9 3-methyltransferase [Chitinophagaceae bacterium]